MQNICLLKNRCLELEKNYYKMKGSKESLEKSVENNEKEKKDLEKRVLFYDKCLRVFQTLAEIKKEEIKKKIESLVTKGLRTIFERSDYRFEIQMELKRGVMTAKPIMYSKFNGEEFSSEITDGHGGGLVNVVSFLLQVIVLLSFSSKIEKVIFADEPFKNVSREYLSNTSEFVSYLSKISGIQFVLITHKTEFEECADKVFKVSLNKDKETIIKEKKR